MTESSANKPANGDACHRASSAKKPGRNGYVKSPHLIQQKHYLAKERVRRACHFRRYFGRERVRPAGAIRVAFTRARLAHRRPPCFLGMMGENGSTSDFPHTHASRRYTGAAAARLS